MCGIAGVAGPGATRESALVRSLLTALAHRGPDDEGLWTGTDVVLGHRRLSILDLTPAGHQPMSYGEGRYWLTYNGEIYNYIELRDELSTRGHSFKTQTDTEVLLAAYAQWGEQCLRRLNGMWAFALWDRETRSLFLTRDRFGKKPLYYLVRRGCLYFASEMKALFMVPGVNRTINRVVLAQFCGERISDHSDETTFLELRQLKPASWLRWDGGKIHSHTYWALPSQLDQATSSAEELGATLEDAVRLRMRADTPIGCLVSGGLDSSTVACLMNSGRSKSAKIHVFTTMIDPANEEVRGVQHVLERGGFEPHFHTPTATSFWDKLPQVLWHQEEPFADGSMVAHFELMREARASGVPVLLAGQGADEVFVGYPTYVWIYLAELVRGGKLNKVLEGLLYAKTNQQIGLRSLLFHVAFHASPRALRSFLRGKRLKRQLDWLQPDLRVLCKPRELYSKQAPDDLHTYLSDSIRYWTIPGFLHYDDRNSMAFGVETRQPYLDYRLVEVLFRTPTESKLANLETKKLLREAAKAVVPRSVLERQAKQGYPAPLRQWLRSLAPQVREVAHSSVVEATGLIDAPKWRSIVDDFLEGNNERLDAVWRGLVCTLWHTHVIRAGDLRQSQLV